MQLYPVLLVGENQWLLRALTLLLESDTRFGVVGISSAGDVINRARQESPRIILFLPEAGFLSRQDCMITIKLSLPGVWLVMVTPADSAPYETVYSASDIRFIADTDLNVELLPQLRALVSDK